VCCFAHFFFSLCAVRHTPQIPVSGLGIGPVHKKDVIKASVMLEHRVEYAVILAFDVKVSADAAEMSAKMGVKIFTADIIYHLFDQCTKYFEDVKASRRADTADSAAFPCILNVLPEHIYRQKDPVIVGVLVKDGICKVGTPLCVPSKNTLQIGKITSIQHDLKDIQEAKKGMEVCIRIEQNKGAIPQIAYGRHFDHTNELVSHVCANIPLLPYFFPLTTSDLIVAMRFCVCV
jgi:translation initiation factor 5B